MTSFWIISGALALLAATWPALSLIRARRDNDPAEASDLQVYRDQLREIDRDVARGVMLTDDADPLRAEVSRRILTADTALRADVAVADAPRAAGRITTGLIIVIVVGGGLGLYANLGAPGYGDLALRDRIAAAETRRDDRPSQAEAEAQAPAVPPVTGAPREYMELVQRLRSTVAERPGDLQGHMLLARSEAALGNFVEAYKSQEQIITLKGDAATAQDYADLADMVVLAAGGYVSPEAERVLEITLSMDPLNGVARYYGGLMLAQNDRPDIAFRMWDDLLRTSTADDAWVPPIVEQIQGLAMRAGVAGYEVPQVGGAPLRGPSAADIDAAQDMTPEERMDMIRGMVEQSSDRLATQGGPPEEWARLIVGYSVLGNAEQAIAIWRNAEEVFAGNDDALKIILEGARNANIAP